MTSNASVHTIGHEGKAVWSRWPVRMRLPAETEQTGLRRVEIEKANGGEDKGIK